MNSGRIEGVRKMVKEGAMLSDKAYQDLGKQMVEMKVCVNDVEDVDSAKSFNCRRVLR